MFCQNCGKQIPENAKFCNHCGAAQVSNAAQKTSRNSSGSRISRLMKKPLRSM